MGSRIRDVRWHRMRTEKKLKESEHDTTSVFTSSTIVLSLSEADGGRCGPSGWAAVGNAVEDAVGKFRCNGK